MDNFNNNVKNMKIIFDDEVYELHELNNLNINGEIDFLFKCNDREIEFRAEYFKYSEPRK